MNPLPRYNEKGELDTRLRVDPVTGDVGIGTPKEKEHMTKEALQTALEALTDFDYDKRMKAIESIKEALETKDEPVYWEMPDGKLVDKWGLQFYRGDTGTPLYTTPQRTWVGLTEEEIDGLHEEIKVRLMGTFNTKDIYRAIEAKLKEKNNV